MHFMFWRTFSKVSTIVIDCSKFSNKLTFENLWQVAITQSALAFLHNFAKVNAKVISYSKLILLRICGRWPWRRAPCCIGRKRWRNHGSMRKLAHAVCKVLYV